jgi:uncharacterized protein YaiI (UPF0178 family)
MQIWIDADACPRPVKETVFRAAEHKRIKVWVVANKTMFVPKSEFVTMKTVSGGPDIADDYIAEHAEKGDITITQDIPLAARLVEKEVVVLSPRGEVFDEDNIRERLSVRDFMSDLRDAGVQTGGPSGFGNKEKNRFASAFQKALAGR